MPAALSIEELQALLSLQRKSLHLALQLQAAGVPVDRAEMIDSARQRLQQLKADLRQRGVAVDDLPEDASDSDQEPASVQLDSSPSVTPPDLSQVTQIDSTISDEAFLQLLDEHRQFMEAQDQLDDVRMTRMNMQSESKPRVMKLWEQMRTQSRTLNDLYVEIIRQKLTRAKD